jgi:hypothetical protein
MFTKNNNISIKEKNDDINSKYLNKKEFIMSIFNMTTATSSKIKDVTLALVFIGSLIGASTSVNAAPVPSVEDAVSEFVVAQGKNMIAELNMQLQQSIDNEINAFSTNFSLNSAAAWLTAEQQVKKATPTMNMGAEKVVQSNLNSSTNINTNKHQTK